jgi:hypothetical protein
MATRKTRSHYKNPKAPVPTGTATKPFLVAVHANIFGENVLGVVSKILGSAETDDDRTIMLTENMASFYANLGYIEVVLDFGIEKDEDIATLQELNKSLADQLRDATELLDALTAAKADPDEQGITDAVVSSLIPSTTDTAAGDNVVEAVAEPTADTSGGVSGGGLGGGQGDEAPKPARTRRRKAV